RKLGRGRHHTTQRALPRHRGGRPVDLGRRRTRCPTVAPPRPTDPLPARADRNDPRRSPNLAGRPVHSTRHRLILLRPRCAVRETGSTDTRGDLADRGATTRPALAAGGTRPVTPKRRIPQSPATPSGRLGDEVQDVEAARKPCRTS